MGVPAYETVVTKWGVCLVLDAERTLCGLDTCEMEINQSHRVITCPDCASEIEFLRSVPTYLD